MTKKDEKDADRPHYYSQFWLDVAAGRRVIGAPKTEEGGDLADGDLSEPTPLARRGGRGNANILAADGYRETHAPTAVADEAYDDDDEFAETEDEDEDEDVVPDLVEVDDEEIPTIVDDTPEVLVPDIEPEPLENEEDEEPEEEEEFFEDEEDEEDEEEWPARGRKKPKPGRQTKAPKPPAKKPKRGRGF